MFKTKEHAQWGKLEALGMFSHASTNVPNKNSSSQLHLLVCSIICIRICMWLVLKIFGSVFIFGFKHDTWSVTDARETLGGNGNTRLQEKKSFFILSSV